MKKTFTIESSPQVIARFERFLALLHYNSRFGHSGLFAMPLDGDGPDRVTIEPEPNHANEVDLLAGIGGDIEIAYNTCYSVKKVSSYTSEWMTCPPGDLYKNGVRIKRIDSHNKDIK